MLAYRHVPPCGKGSINPAGSGAQGAADRPYPPRRPPHTAPPAWAGWGGTGRWRRTLAGGWSAPSPPRRRRRWAPSAAGLPGPAAGGGGRRRRRRRRRPLPWGGLGGLAGREKTEGGQLVRQERRGVDKGSDGRLPTPPVLREGHPEPVIDDRGCLERVVGKVRMAGHREAAQQRSSRQQERERERTKERERERSEREGGKLSG